MKKFFAVGLVLLLALIVVGTVSAAPEVPPQPDPLCVWVEEVTHDEWIEPVTHVECTCPTLDGVEYIKSEDPTKCHRPSVKQLMKDYSMTLREAIQYTQTHREWIDADCEVIVDEEGYFIVVVDAKGYWDCPEDVCPNLEGIQVEIPEGYVKPGKRCVPKPVPGPITPTVAFQQGCVDGVPVIGIEFAGEDGDSLSITGNGRDLSYTPGVYREKMRPFDSYAWLISRGERGVERGKLLVEVCPADPTPTPPPDDPPETGGGDASILLVGAMGALGMLTVALGARGYFKGRKEG